MARNAPQGWASREVAETEAPRGRIFISYRRSDTPHVAGRLFDRLVARFGAGNVFIDVDTIEPGLDFTDAIADAVGACDVLLALIGSHWLDAADDRGRRRLDDPDDLVVVEIATALQRQIRVIPVLVDGAAHRGAMTFQSSWLPSRDARLYDSTTPRSAPESACSWQLWSVP